MTVSYADIFAEYSRFSAKLDLCRAVLLQFGSGEYDVAANPDLAECIAALAQALKLPDDWQSPAFAAALEQRISTLLVNKARTCGASNGKARREVY
jgi:hypothetical protein